MNSPVSSDKCVCKSIDVEALLQRIENSDREVQHLLQERVNFYRENLLRQESTQEKSEGFYKRTFKIAGESVGAASSIGVCVAGGVLCVAFPPVGIPLLALGIGGLATSATFLGIDSSMESRINQILSVHRDLSYVQAEEIAKNGSIVLGDSEGNLFKYTATERTSV